MSLRWRAVTVVAAIAAIVGAAVLGRELVSTDRPSEPVARATPTAVPPAATAAPTSQPPAAVPEGFVRYEDRTVGFSIALPKSWKRLSPSDPEVALLATQGRRNSLLVRVSRIGLRVTPQSLPLVRELTDRLVRAGGGDVRMLGRPRAVELGGLPGFRYFYTYDNADTAGRGAHAHYFLFKGQQMIALVFQVTPAERLVDEAPALDRVVKTFRG